MFSISLLSLIEIWLFNVSQNEIQSSRLHKNVHTYVIIGEANENRVITLIIFVTNTQWNIFNNLYSNLRVLSLS